MLAPTPKPTERQSKILAVIRRSMAERGMPPTIREIGASLGIKSPNGVMCHITALHKKGLLRLGNLASSRRWVPVVDEGCCPCCGQPMPGETA